MGGFVWAVRSGLVWPPFDPGAAARYYDFMPYILHLPWKEEVLVDAPKHSVYQLSLWLSCHIPPRCRWSVPGPQYARTSPKKNSPKFAKNNALNGTKFIANSSALASVGASADLGGADESRPFGRR